MYDAMSDCSNWNVDTRLHGALTKKVFRLDGKSVSSSLDFSKLLFDYMKSAVYVNFNEVKDFAFSQCSANYFPSSSVP